LTAELERQSNGTVEIPLIIGGREVRTGNVVPAVVPHRFTHVLAHVHQAGPTEVEQAVRAAEDARGRWATTPPEARAAIFLRAAELLAGPWRMRLNAATMLNQSKTCREAEIDAACETVDFFRFNGRFMEEIDRHHQPPVNPPGAVNALECRPLEGFVYAITPFNFTSIAANLPHAPALMGNTVIWKPSPGALYSNYMVMRLFQEAGLPPGIINFVPGDAEAVSSQLFAEPGFAGVHYTGSTAVFRGIWRRIAETLPSLRNYPRIVGETGGKDFIVAHPSADPAAVVTALVRGGYEYQGQKCSAVSRVYLPRSLWSVIEDKLVSEIRDIPVGDVADFDNFMGAVIHEAAFDRCRRFIEQARSSSEAEILAGGDLDGSIGYFVSPTLILARTPQYPSLREEIFGPVVTLFLYDDADYEATLELCDQTSPYALTGAIFARDRSAIDIARDRLRYAAGNFYVNDKPTGAVVGQQPFGGARASGTNDKAGSALNLLRWVSPRTIKETFVPPTDYRYAYMDGATKRSARKPRTHAGTQPRRS
jgi:1-pyrroline-5-carboxylate dehydrogenase